MNPETALLLLKVIDLVAAGLELLPELEARRSAQSEAIRKMIEEARGPSPEEFAALFATSEELTARIREEAERKAS